MENTFVLKNVEYAAKKGGGSIADATEAGLLVPGAVAVFADGKLVSQGEDLSALSASTKISIAVGYPTSEKDIDNTEGTRLSARFPMGNILRSEVTSGISPVAKVETISGFSDTIGEGIITIYERGYDRTFNLDRFSVSAIRREGETLEDFVKRVVDKFNEPKKAGFAKHNNMATAEAVKVGSEDGIKFTSKSAEKDIVISTSGIFEFAVHTIDTERVLPLNTPKQVYKDEQLSTPMFGDSGYENGEYFNRTSNVDFSVDKYAGINIDIQRIHNTPTNVENSMVSNITIYGTSARVNTIKAIIDALGKPVEANPGP